MTNAVLELSNDVTGALDIQRAQRDDMDYIADFVRSTAEWYRPILDEKDMGEHNVSEEWKDINFKRREFYIGYCNDIPIGTISIQDFGDYAYLGYIYLDARYVGKGFGQQLMHFIKEVAQERGFKGLALISHPLAEWAVKAYTKFGFKPALTQKEEVVAWNQGCLKGYYEEHFHLFLYDFEDSV